MREVAIAALEEFEEILRRRGELTYLDRLVRKGCDRIEIFITLDMIRQIEAAEFDSWKFVAGMSLRQLKATVDRIRGVGTTLTSSTLRLSLPSQGLLTQALTVA